jgi:serine/threonine-protein phosphatase 2A regulatory subunit B
MITAITYDKTGEFLAVGDKGGRVIIFRYNTLKNSRYFDYRYFTEMQSHELEFDYLKSIEIEEKITSLVFMNSSTAPLHMLSTNSKVIKLWKIAYHEEKEYSKCQID